MFVNLRLRQIQQVFAFDVARTHVVADRVADDFAMAIDDERQFGFGHVPLGVLANANGLAGPATFSGSDLKNISGRAAE